MTPGDLAARIRLLALEAIGLHDADDRADAVRDAIRITSDAGLSRPRDRVHGDWASTVALALGRALGVEAQPLARRIADGLAEQEGIASVEVAGPGFLNIRLDAASGASVVARILGGDETFGRVDRIPTERGPVTTDESTLGEARRVVVDAALERLAALLGDRPTPPMQGEPMRRDGDGRSVTNTVAVDPATDRRPAVFGDLVAFIGRDSAIYASIRVPLARPLVLDPMLLGRRTDDNPVHLVQYAHARTVAVSRVAAELGVDRASFDPGLLHHETETALLGALQDFPRVLRQAADRHEPHRLARHLEDIVHHHHRWTDVLPIAPMGDAPVEAAHRSRLALNDATGRLIRTALVVLGVAAPERI